MTPLREAAQAVLDRWDSPAWEWLKQGPTAALMADLRAALAEPVQEPVAWMMVNETYATACERKLMWKPAKNWHPTWEAVPLYTSPPQRKPLTEEEIQELSQQHKFDSRMEKFVRIIERAHGIGGNDE